MKTGARNKSGFSILAVLFVITALALMMSMLIRISGQRAYTAKRYINKTKSMAYAEAGIDYAYSILSVDFDKRSSPDAFAYGTFEDGSFTLSVTPISNKYALVSSVGKCGDAVSTAEVLIDDENAYDGATPFPDYSSMEGFNYAVLSGGVYDFGGVGTVTGLKMHSNSSIAIRGSADSTIDISSSSMIRTSKVTIEGSITAPEIDAHPKADITGGATEAAVPPVAIPDIDLTPYFNWAKMHGEVHNGFTTSSSYTPNGGILWVEGDVYIDDHAQINGSIIATGNIYISGNVSINPTTTTFAMASRDGNIFNTSSGTINGLIYAKTGDYTQTANGTLNGQLIVNGYVRKGGNSDVINYVRSVPTDPYTSSTTPTSAWPVISAWQK